jgi:outer membrane cobalamin receptor
MKISKQYYCFLILLFICGSVAAQTIVKGKVVDAQSRQPLEAASVMIATATNEKVITDEYGNFILKTTQQNKTVTVSHIGYKTLIADADNNNVLIIALQPDAIRLEDVKLQSGPAKFSSLAKIDLALSPVKNTQELLRIVPGLFIAQHAGGGKAEQIFLRGFDCDHGTDVQVSVDGMPVNMVSHAHGQGYADAHFIIPETINNIDFGAGPYYTQHGNLNTAGYVAFSTYKNIPKSLVQTEVGQFNSFRTVAMLDLLKKNKDQQSAYIAGEFNYTDGATQHPQNFNRINLFAKYNTAINTNTSLSLSASAFKSKWDASGQVPTRAVESGFINRFGSIDPSEGGNTERYNANAVLSHQFSNGAVLDNQVFYSRYLFNLYSNFSFFLNDPVNGDEINQAEARNIFGYASVIKQKYFFAKWQLTSTGGIGIRHDATINSKLAHVVKRQFLNDIQLGDIKETNTYAFTQQQASMGKWVIDAGMRADHFQFNYFNKLAALQMPSQSKAIISPKLNVQYNVNKKVQLYIKTGKGFHSNDTRVVIANEGKQILPAAYGNDIGVLLKPTKDLLLNIAAWNLYLDQEFVYVGDDGNIEPSGKTKRQGLDIIARYQFTKYLFANANINFTKPRARDAAKGQDYIPLAPTATSTGGIFYKKPNGFNGGIKYRYIKNRPANEENTIIAKGYFLLDASVNYTQAKYEIGVSVENLLNAKWNEAQFATESRLQNEPNAVTELNFTPGTPLFAKVKLAVFF